MVQEEEQKKPSNVQAKRFMYEPIAHKQIIEMN